MDALSPEAFGLIVEYLGEPVEPHPAYRCDERLQGSYWDFLRDLAACSRYHHHLWWWWYHNQMDGSFHY